MAFESLTDVKIDGLLSCPKQLNNPNARIKTKEKHEQVNYSVVATDGSDYQFELYKRQNTMLGMEDDFSCGISWVSPSGETITLKRYNGASHDHPNHLENERLGHSCHIHKATEKYIKANRKPEGYAEKTERYTTVDGALHCLVTDCNISGITTTPDITNQTNLFDQ